MIDGSTTMTDSGLETLRDRVARALDERVRAEIGADGDDMELVGIDRDRIVQVRLLGGCGLGCSSAMVARLLMVDAILRAEVPEIRFVEAVP